MLRVLAFAFVSLLAAQPLAAAAQTRHTHHPPSSPAKSVESPSPVPAGGNAKASAFSRYQRFTPDEPLKNWREVNDTVRAIGGWQAYGMEAARAIEAEKKQSEKEKGAKP